MYLGGEGLGRLGNGDRVPAEEGRGRALGRRRLGGGRRCASQRREGDAAGGLAAPLTKPLTRQLGAEAVEGAGTNVAGAGRGVRSAGAGGAALGGVATWKLKGQKNADQ